MNEILTDDAWYMLCLYALWHDLVTSLVRRDTTCYDLIRYGMM